jgi:hypothetical protein
MLENIKKDLERIAEARKVINKFEVSLTVSLYFFDNVFNEVPLVAIPVEAQTTLPCYLFGLNDFKGGFINCSRVVPLTPPWQLQFGAQSWGINFYNNYGGTPIPLRNHLDRGDLILTCVYIQPPFGFIWTASVVVHCGELAYGTFLQSLWSDYILIDQMKYVVPMPQINQFNNPLIFGHQSLLGQLFTDSVDSRLYILPTTSQQNIAEMPIEIPLDKGMFCAFNINVTCQQLNFVLFVREFEPMTYRQ